MLENMQKGDINMNIIEQIDIDSKEALKNKDKDKLTLLRMLKTSLLNTKISLGHVLSEDEVIGVLRKEVKQRKDNIEEYKKYGKDDVVSTLESEVEIINKYLPEELSNDVINNKLDEIFDEVKPQSIKDMGKVMGKAVSIFGNNVDKGRLSNMIKERLGNI